MGERYSQLVHFSLRAQLILLLTLSVILFAVIGLSLKSEYTPTDTIGRTTTVPETPVEKPVEQPKEEPVSKQEETKVVAAAPQVAVESNDQNTADVTVDSQSVATEDKKETEQSTPEAQPTNTSELKDYTFTAQPGDSYTKMARAAINQYSATNKVVLQAEEIEKAAARLAYNAGSPFLEINQSVTIASSDIAPLVGGTPQITETANATTPSGDNATNNTPTPKTYSFVAVSGNSYSIMARKAIADYVTTNNVQLSNAQKIAAETYIISDAGFPELEVGQTVTFTNETIKNALDKALALSPAQLALWQPYTDKVVI